MRDIKFRAWDKKSKKIKVVTGIDFVYYNSKFKHATNIEGSPIDFWLNNESESYLGQEIELMQYTGLKDKNGKEIYEGDIVRVEIHDCFSGHVILSGNKVVEFKNSKFGIDWGNDNTFSGFDCFSSKTTFEVIGNIYENPDLLELLQ